MEGVLVMRSRPDWSTDGADWPHREFSSFIEAGGLRWHVQQAGAGPDLLLLHGTGASTHSWAGLLPHLTGSFRVTAPDLPGHGFTSAPALPRELGMVGMARALSALLRHLALRPALLVGHSAGAALAARLTLDGVVAPAGLVGLNPSLAAPAGRLTELASALCGPVFRSSLVADLASSRIREGALLRVLLRSTGSRVPPGSLALYRRLLGHPAALGSVLAMMSAWEPGPLADALGRLQTPVLLLAGGGDRWIPTSSVRRVALSIPRTRVVELPGMGHLAHEEAPGAVAPLILRFAGEVGCIPARLEDRSLG
jgi:magnesium chelatase accessory protein